MTYTESSMCSEKLKSKDQFCSITYPTGFHMQTNHSPQNISQVVAKKKSIYFLPTDLHVQITPVRSFVILTCNTSCPVADAHTAYKWYWNRKLYNECEHQDITILKPKAAFFSCALKSNEDVLSRESCEYVYEPNIRTKQTTGRLKQK